MADRQIVVRLRAETALYEAGMRRASAATQGVAASAAAASKTATAANVGLTRSAAATAAGMKVASNSMSGVASAARGTSGSVAALGSGMAVASTRAGTLGSGMKAAASSTAGVNAAVRGASGSMTALGSGMGIAATAATRASGSLKAVGGAASAAGAGASSASGGLRTMGGAAVTAAAGASSATGSLDKVGSSARVAGAGAGAATAGFGRLSGSIKANRSEWSSLSTTAMVAGGAVIAGLGLATKAAISWESAWAGVQKTNDGNAQQMAKLEGELRGLAKTLPATHTEIAAVAEAAGQLGIKRENVASFTKTMIDMGEATNMSADQAATSIARFTNVMGTAQTDVDKVGSAIVGLGNNFATTESEITEMSLRLAGAGRQANMTEGDVLGIATAMSSVGIQAQAGGTAMSKVIIEMGKSVDMGNDKLETFAETAGMSTEAFSKLWNENSGEAMQRFITGLGDMQDRGESLEPTLEALGMTDIRVGDALRRSASAADQFGSAMERGNKDFAEGAALAEEASVRYETTESRMRIAMNSIKDAAIDLGSVIGPALAKVAEGAVGLANAFVKLPGPVKSVITGLAGISGAALLIGGATVKAIGAVQSFRGALDTLGVSLGRLSSTSPRAARAITALGAAAKIGAVVTVGVVALNKLDSALQATAPSAGDLSDALDKVAQSGSLQALNSEFSKFFDQSTAHEVLFGKMSVDINSVGDAVDYLNNKSKPDAFTDWKNGLLGLSNSTDKAEKSLKAADEAMTEMFQQDPSQALAIWKQLVEDTRKAGGSVEELKKRFPGLVSAMESADDAARDAGHGSAEMALQADEAADAVAGLADEIKGLGETLLGERGGAREYQAALDDMADSIKENGRTLDITTEKGRANEAALDDLASSTQEWAASTVEAGGSAEKAQGILDRGRSKWIEYATSMGMSKTEARALAEELFKIPEDVTTDFEAKGAEAAKKGASDFKAMVTGIPSTAETNVSAPGAKMATDETGQFKGMVAGVPTSKGTNISAPGALESGAEVSFMKDTIGLLTGKSVTVKESGASGSATRVTDLTTQITGLNGKKVSVLEAGAAGSKGRVLQLDGSILGLDSKTVTVKEVGATASGDRVVVFDGKIYRLNGKTVTVKEDGASASTGRVQGLTGVIGFMQGKNVDVRANAHGRWDVQALTGDIGNVRSKTVTVRAVTQRVGKWFSADGGMYAGGPAGFHQTFADGGFVGSLGSAQPQIRAAGGGGITWAEEGAGPWESFISGHPAKAGRSKAIWLETGKKLGMIQAHADGAMRQYASSPPPQRHYVAPPQRAFVQAPQAAAPVPSGPSGADMERAFSSAMSQMRPVVEISGREFYGVMQRVTNDRKGR